MRRAHRLIRGLRALSLALAVLFPAAALAECRQALILALDVSGSVDDREYRLQLDGVATALDDDRVRAAILSMPDAPVAFAVFEWSSGRFQRDLVPWTILGDDAAIDGVIARLLGTGRVPAPQSTGIGAALEHAARRLGAGPACWTRTVDVSGDGRNNDWPTPRDVHAAGRLSDVTVNALVIGQDDARGEEGRQVTINELMAYFRAEVISGPDAFIESASGYDDFADAMTRKLLKELRGMAVGALDASRPATVQ